jgi:hypothetical protein
MSRYDELIDIVRGMVRNSGYWNSPDSWEDTAALVGVTGAGIHRHANPMSALSQRD